MKKIKLIKSLIAIGAIGAIGLGISAGMTSCALVTAPMLSVMISPSEFDLARPSETIELSVSELNTSSWTDPIVTFDNGASSSHFTTTTAWTGTGLTRTKTISLNTATPPAVGPHTITIAATGYASITETITVLSTAPTPTLTISVSNNNLNLTVPSSTATIEVTERNVDSWMELTIEFDDFGLTVVNDTLSDFTLTTTIGLNPDSPPAAGSHTVKAYLNHDVPGTTVSAQFNVAAS